MRKAAGLPGNLRAGSSQEVTKARPVKARPQALLSPPAVRAQPMGTFFIIRARRRFVKHFFALFHLRRDKLLISPVFSFARPFFRFQFSVLHATGLASGTKECYNTYAGLP